MSFKLRAGIGLLVSYISFEAYLHLSTIRIINNRRKESEKLMANSSDQKALTLDMNKLKSATVAGMFVNPFDEYRPQTAFEFFAVRCMEIVESIYGTYFEIHNKVLDGGMEVEDLIKPYTPNLELLRTNTGTIQDCLRNNDFRRLNQVAQATDIGPAVSHLLPPLGRQLVFTWLGQSCSLIQISGINFLTDPLLCHHLYSEKIGPKRLVDLPMTKDEVSYATNKSPDFILVSHDHPDHLELDLIKHFGNSSAWIVPLGLKKKLARRGVYNVIEMDWWESTKINRFLKNGENLPDEYEIQCIPSMHWSGRYVIDSNKSLWCSYIIKRNGQSLVYHAGDTGYLRPLFETMGKLHGPVFLSLLPIGQYCPSWHQKPRHISPLEALQICGDITSKYMWGVHWGTFKLSKEPILEPKKRLEELTAIEGTSGVYRVPHLGKTYIFDCDKQCEIDLI